MILNLRTRLRAIVTTTICALILTPALVAGTGSTATGAPPGINTSTLTVNGLGTGVASGLGTNPWHFDGGGYTELQAALKDTQNFGPNGVFKKGQYSVPATSMTGPLRFPGNLSALDVFFAGLPTSEYDPDDIAALQAFNADGRALVLNANDEGFGEVAAFLGFGMRSERAFFGPDGVCGWTNNGGAAGTDSAPSKSQTTGGHPIQTQPFGAAPTVSNYHTVQVFTSLPAQAQTLYNLNVSGQQAQLAVTGPVGQILADGTNAHVSFENAVVSGAADITTAVLTPSGIQKVDFYYDTVGVATLIGTDSSGPSFTAPWNTVGVAEGQHTIIAVGTRTDGVTTFLNQDPGLQVIVDNLAPFEPAPAAGTHRSPLFVQRDCPGAQEVVDNNISGPTVAVIPKGALSANSGPIVVTSDLDMMSNAFGTSWSENRTFALNAFAWIMDQLLPDIPDDTYFPLQNPVRVYDSRLATPLTHDESRPVQVAGVMGVPSDAKTVLANVTVVDPSSSGYFTVYPTGSNRPVTSTHNFAPGENFANMVVMQVGQGGAISVYDYLDSGGTVGVIVDVIGYTRRDNSGTRLHTIAPGRLLDTRVGTGLSGPFGPGSTRNLTVRGAGTGVPNDAESVVLNMTVTNATRTGSFVTVWPAGEPQPLVSNLNNVEGIARPNLVVARVGAGGQISIANDSGNADLIADVVGYFSAGAYKSGGVITGLNPVRILDTRSPSNPFTSGQVRTYTVAGVGGIPGSAKTAILKVTAVEPTGGGYVTVWPAGSANPPNVSNLNFGPNMTIPNLVVTQIGSGGQINLFNSVNTTTHILIDVLGYAD